MNSINIVGVELASSYSCVGSKGHFMTCNRDAWKPYFEQLGFLEKCIYSMKGGKYDYYQEFMYLYYKLNYFVDL